MVCYHPLAAIKITNAAGNVNVKVLGDSAFISDRESRIGVVKVDTFQTLQYIEVPCGRCVGCRLERSRNWAIRCVHEASLYKENCFLTLTYDNEHLPSDGSLVKKDLQDFWKRLRKAIYPAKVRYFACGEYGTLLHRPHYHACLFGYWPSDAKLWNIRHGSKLYVSNLFAQLWPYGFHSIGAVSFESAAYVARYCLKKINGDRAADHYNGLEPEFVVMSRRPGIGKDWILKFYDDVYPHDYIVIRDGIKCRPPSYYDKIYDLECNGDLEYIKNKRSDPKFHKPISLDRLNDMEKCKKNILKSRNIRKYEENIE